MEMTIHQLLQKNFPKFENGLINSLSRLSIISNVNTGEQLMHSGQYVRSVMLVLDGRIKLYRENEAEGEYFIYDLLPGSACALSMVCAGKQSKIEIKAVAAEDSVVIKIPVEQMDTLVKQFTSWYHFVVETYRTRFEDLLLTFDNVIFKSMDHRLLSYLQQQAQSLQSNRLSLTHQQIATDLHSSREVISRLLKKLEQNGTVRLRRNEVEYLSYSFS